MGGRRIDFGEATEAGAAIGIQLTGNSRIGTFVQGIDAATATKISETLNDISNTLVVIQTGADAHQHPIDENPAFQTALLKAQRMWEAGLTEEASRSFMDALEHEEGLERERQEDRKRFRLRLLEEGLVYDKRVPNAEAAFGKLRLIAEVIHPSDQNAQGRYLMDRASVYQWLGTARGDTAALHIAVSVFSWLAKGAINVGR